MYGHDATSKQPKALCFWPSKEVEGSSVYRLVNADNSTRTGHILDRYIEQFTRLTGPEVFGFFETEEKYLEAGGR